MPTDMTPRERVRRAVEFQGPDRVPVHRYIFPGAYRRHGRRLVDFLDAQPDDFGVGPAAMPEPDPDPDTPLEEYRDEWGSLWVRLKGYTTGEVREPALPSWDAYGAYRLPEPPADTRERLERRIRDSEHRYFTIGPGGHVFERLQFIRGTENLFADLAEDRDEIHDLADRVVGYHRRLVEDGVAAGVDCIGFGDDWGAQRSLLISPDMWRRFFKPRYARLFAPARDAGVHIWFHTDGWTLEILDDLIELGVTILNPQHHCMGDEVVARKIAGRVCLRSDLDRQWIIPYGTPQEIENHVQDVIRLFGTYDGGLILHGEVGPDVPFENIQALYGAYLKFGRYPLDWL